MNVKKININYKIACLFLIGIMLLIMRSSYIFNNPIMYAEDGVWSASLLQNGLWHTLINSRSDYFALGNLLLLQMANILNYIFCGYNLTNLPLMVALVQYLFYSLIAIGPLLFLRGYLSKKICVLIWLLTILCPFSNSGFEILGRLSNSGFLFPLLSFYLIAWRAKGGNDKKYIKIIAIDIVLFICAATNPICFVFIGIGFLLDTFKYFKKHHSLRLMIKEKSYILYSILIFLLFLLGIIIMIRMKGVINPYDTILNTGSIIEFIFRSMIYSFTFPFYTHINDSLAIFFFVIIIVIVCLACFITSKKKAVFLICSFFATVLATTVMLITRSGMTTTLFGYQTTAMDRYYYGQNLLSLIPVITALSYIAESKSKSVKVCFSILPLFFVIGMYGLNYKFFFELSSSRYQEVVSSFAESITFAYENNSINEEGNYMVQIEPSPWFMNLEPKYIEETIRQQKVHSANVTDDNFENGISKAGGMLLFENTKANNKSLEDAKELYSSGAVAKVSKVKIDNSWIYVYFEATWNTNISLFGSTEGIEISR